MHDKPERVNITERELDMIEMRRERKTLGEIGMKYGISRERVRQIVIKAESKLAKHPAPTT
jgi:DNA-directed RNA polymerase sigma subunit (sigma70/sigma32)